MVGEQIQTNLIQLVQSEGVGRYNLHSEHGHLELCQDVLGMSSFSTAGDQALQQNTKLRRTMQKAIGPLSNREQVCSYFCICSNANLYLYNTELCLSLRGERGVQWMTCKRKREGPKPLPRRWHLSYYPQMPQRTIDCTGIGWP